MRGRNHGTKGFAVALITTTVRASTAMRRNANSVIPSPTKMEKLISMVQEAFNGNKLGSHHGTVREVVISTDGKLAGSASGDHTGKIWNLETQKCISTLGSRPQNLTGGGIGSGHQHIVTGSFL